MKGGERLRFCYIQSSDEPGTNTSPTVKAVLSCSFRKPAPNRGCSHPEADPQILNGFPFCDAKKVETDEDLQTFLKSQSKV